MTARNRSWLGPALAIAAGVLLAVAILARNAHGQQSLIPPDEYLKQFAGQVIIWPSSHYGAMSQCGDMGMRGADHCSKVIGAVCTIVMTHEGYTEQQVVQIFIAERAHCNGWQR